MHAHTHTHSFTGSLLRTHLHIHTQTHCVTVSLTQLDTRAPHTSCTIHTHTRANNELQPKHIALLQVASNCLSTSSLSISKSVRIFIRTSPVSLLSVIVLRKICL